MDFVNVFVDVLKVLKFDGIYDKVFDKWGVKFGAISDFVVNL